MVKYDPIVYKNGKRYFYRFSVNQRIQHVIVFVCVILLALTGFHGLSMTPVWENFEPGTTDVVGLIREGLSVGSLTAFTVGMVLVMALPFAAYAGITWVAWRWVHRATGARYKDLLVAYAYAVLPVALFYHLAHNAMHLFMEGQEVIPLLREELEKLRETLLSQEKEALLAPLEAQIDEMSKL